VAVADADLIVAQPVDGKVPHAPAQRLGVQQPFGERIGDRKRPTALSVLLPSGEPGPMTAAAAVVR
jgi:hypothetical protein